MDINQIFEFELNNQKELDDAILQERAGGAVNFYNNQFKTQLQKMIFQQLDSFVNRKGDEEFIRGTLNGFQLIDDWFQLQMGIIKNKDKE